MKNFIVAISIALGLFIASCGSDVPSGKTQQDGTSGNIVNDDNQVNNQTGNLPPANDSFVNSVPSGEASNATASPVARGASLIASQNCKTCHNTQGKNIGPSYQMIADKYGNSAGMADNLSLKIIKGGSGRWGQVVMPPHNDVSTADARDMARYILSLSNSSTGMGDTTAGGK